MPSAFWEIFRNLVFNLDPEVAHSLAIKIFNNDSPFSNTFSNIFGTKIRKDPVLTLWGVPFLSRVGLAAGFDKNAELVRVLPNLGFGFAEIGTVTPRPQEGNKRPRIFRVKNNKSIFNRMGFNNDGADVVSRRLWVAREKIPENFRIGVNLGKNKDTDLKDAHKDYVEAASKFKGLCDYIVLNVSSPNTPGLRLLQSEQNLLEIVKHVQDELSSWQKVPPLLIKLAPEVKDEELINILKAGDSWGISGWVLTNTLNGEFKGQSGGWSGKLLTQHARDSLVKACQYTKLPIISVGGILCREEAYVRIKTGASLVQIYTGWIYNGPEFPKEIDNYIESKLN